MVSGSGSVASEFIWVKPEVDPPRICALPRGFCSGVSVSAGQMIDKIKQAEISCFARGSGCPKPAQQHGPARPCHCANPVGRDQLPVRFGIPPLEKHTMQGDLEQKGGGPDYCEQQAAEEECI